MRLHLKESDEFTRICEEIRNLKGQPYLDGIFRKSPNIGTQALKGILNSLQKKDSKSTPSEPQVQEEPKELTPREKIEKEIKFITDRLEEPDLKGQEESELKQELRELERELNRLS